MNRTICLSLAAALASIAFGSAALAQGGPPSPESILASADANKDGGISKEEWATLGAPIEFPVEADKNKDGKLDLAELKALFAQFG